VTKHPGIEANDQPEGWGWCYVDEVMFDLSDRPTPHLGPIPRYYWAQQAMIAAVQSNKRPSSHVMSVAKFEQFFRIAAGLDVRQAGPQALQRLHQSQNLRPSGSG
jgi:hypothetical protein